MKHAVQVAALCAALVGTTGAFASGSYDYGDGRIRGSGVIRSESRNVTPFSSIVVEGSGDVTVSQSLVQSVAVETDDNVLPVVKTEVVGGVLHLGIQPGTRSVQYTRLSFRISAPSIEGISIKGSGDVHGATTLRAEQVSLEIGGSGSIDATIATGTVRAAIGGSGSITLDGTTRDLVVTIGGSGSVRARDLAGTTASVTINGSGGADVTASSTVDIRISGSGDVTYGGGGRATVKSSGSGTARQR